MVNKTFKPTKKVSSSAWVGEEMYSDMYNMSVADPEKFWGDQAKSFEWIKPFTKVKDI